MMSLLPTRSLNLCAAVLIVTFLLSSPVLGEEKQSTISRNTFKKLSKIELLIESDKIQGALGKVDKLLSKLPKRSADRAYIYLAKANILLRMDDYSNAVKYFSLSQQQNGLSKASSITVSLTLANLNLYSENYPEAIAHFVHYKAHVDQPVKEAYYGLATAYYQTEQFSKAIAPLEDALVYYKSDKNILLMLFSSHYELGHLGKAANIMENIVRQWPDKNLYWTQLASLYIQNSEIAKAISTFESAYQIDKLLTQSDILQFVYQLNDFGIPFKAASVLEASLKDKVLARNEKHLNLLASLYLESSEENLALQAFERASQYAKKGNTDLIIAQLHYDKNNYKKAKQYTQLALKKGVHSKGSAYMLLASIHFSLGDINHTREYLLKASKHKETRKSSKSWLASLSTTTQ